MRKTTLFIGIVILLFHGVAFADWEKIVAKEIDGYFYNLSDSKMEPYKPEFEITYHRIGDEIRRVGVYNTRTKEIIPDDTVYKIQRQLWSDPTKKLSLQATFDKMNIRAIGQPGTDSIEILTFGKDFVLSVRSTGDHLTISKLKRIK
ncbi:MAG: hypothetical protein A4E59_01025 [Syntrophorhabdus sp. PtaB.Bin027]|jgi:hypothetical protein|nr:MAG: hypothetical protein A4E59_01025 [Syntrophorhabdus sp. PtaB.Bin027]